MKISERFKDYTYILHALIIWGASMPQIIHVYKEQSAEDILWYWIGGLLLSELLALPRAFGSPYLVWKACHVVSTILIGVLLAGVIIY